MAITSCWNGSCYELFSSEENAVSAAEEIISGYQNQRHPMGDCTASQLIEKKGEPYRYWFKPAHTREDGEFIGFQESPGCITGDDSPEVAAAIAQWWRDRDAARNSDCA